jgi:uncharacterized protein
MPEEKDRKDEEVTGLATKSNSPTRLSISILFDKDLRFFLKRSHRETLMNRVVDHKTSVKDVIESCGVPHTEVDLILVDGQSVRFSYQIRSDQRVEVFPFSTVHDVGSRLQERGIETFVADGHLGKLARDLRLLGIDVLYDNTATDQDLVAIVRRTGRALLSRDRRLLMHGVIKNGFSPRSQQALEQTREVVQRFELSSKLAPFTRCLRCNGTVRPTPKESVLGQLQPLTRLYYNDFTRCAMCGQTYWHGSHLEKLQKRVRAISNQ